MGVAYLVGAFVPSELGWPLGAFAAAAYLMVVGFENAAADLELRNNQALGGMNLGPSILYSCCFHR